METTFPHHFRWGVATSAHQVEGYNFRNDGWLLEHTPDSPWRESSGDACDHYSRYREDIALFSTLGFGLYRFALEWSRIQPEENIPRWDGKIIRWRLKRPSAMQAK